VAAAVIVGLLGLLAGYLIWGTDDDDTTSAAVEDTVPGATADEALVAERDQLAQQVQEQQGQIEDLQSQVEALTAERDELQSQLDDAGDEQVVTTPAPEVTGGTAQDADGVAQDNGWTLVEREVPADGQEPGTVIAQYPEPGTPMIEGSVLVVDVASEGDGG
jgi:Tfp pilus assembly protein FimV